MTNPDAQRIADILPQYSSCLIATHINPEGDAIGSMLALAMALEEKGIEVYCYDRDGVPENCLFLPTWERVEKTLPAIIPPLVIIVDADRIERCNISREDIAGAEMIVRIDHHVSEAKDIGPALVNTKSAAAGELVFELLPLMGATLTNEIATCLLTALMVDSGRFSYSNTTPTTHHIAAELVAAGADLAAITEWTWGRVSFPSTKLLGCALSSLQRTTDEKIAWGVLREQDFKFNDALDADTEGIIDHIRCIKDLEVALLFSEKRGVVRVSLRSHGVVDVAKIARQFGGGGHVKAAGLTFDGPMESAVKEVITAIEAAL